MSSHMVAGRGQVELARLVMKELLRVEDLTTYFYSRWGLVKAVDGVSFSLDEGQTLGLVGESGCGKSVTALSILRLVPRPGKIVGGRILLEGQNLLEVREEEMRKIRGRRISMILQDPMTALNPVFSVGYQLKEGITIHQHFKGERLRKRAVELLRLVRIASPEVRLQEYPHQMSGGMRQRVVGAIALSGAPRLLIADEPTTSLDASIQAQYLNLLKEIQGQTGSSFIFITHDFGIVALMCTKVAVMYAGKIVEMANVREIFNNPLHPYTSALMRSVPKLEGKLERLATIEGQPPPLYDLPRGCSFWPRCEFRSDKRCTVSAPSLVEVEQNHSVRCWNFEHGTHSSAQEC